MGLISQKTFVSLVILFLSSILLFSNLGTYALWDDEAETALGARGVLASGDTTALIGKNINARRGGINLLNLSDRLTPPLPTYLTALSFKLGKENAFFARIPFALCGLLTVSLMLVFLLLTNSSFYLLGFFSIALLCNVPFFLYFRQDRYYGLALLLSVALFILYLSELRQSWQRILYSLFSFFLFFSHPIIFAETQAAILADWIFFGPKKKRFDWSSFLEMSIPFLMLSLPCFCIWNPFLVKAKSYMEAVSMMDRIVLIWRNFRDIFVGELIPTTCLIYATTAYIISKNKNILRTAFAILVIIITTSAISYQNINVTYFADIRYELTIIPIGIALSTLSFVFIFQQRPWIGMVVAIILMGTNIGSGKILYQKKLHSLPFQFFQELIHPIKEPYTPVAQWIRENIPPGSSILVEPDYMMYPLMFHAPNAIYAWQIENKFDPQFQSLDQIHFRGVVLPDYLVCFGPPGESFLEQMNQAIFPKYYYQKIYFFDTCWHDCYRPEIFWRSFTSLPITNASEQIFICIKSSF